MSLMKELPWGGSEVLWHAAAMYALKQGDKVLVSVHKWDYIPHQIELLQNTGATILFRKRKNYNLRRLQKLIHFLKKPKLNIDYQSIINFKPDIVFISQGENFNFALDHKYLYNLLRNNVIPYSLVCHSHLQYSFIPPKEIYPGAINIFKNAKEVFFVSERQWKLTERRLAHKLDNAKLTWNPLNLNLPSVALPWIQGSIINMALVGAFLGHKGQDTAMEVLSSPEWKERKWKLNIYGSGEGEKYLKDLAIFYNIQQNIVFHGHVNDVIQIWLQNHILLIPSSQEGLPISLIEAMACGRPAIVTDIGGNTELIVENETGFIAASPTTGSFAGAMERGWDKKNNWRAMGLKSFEIINKKVDKRPEIRLYEMLKDVDKQKIEN